MATHSKATTLTAQNVTSHLAQVFAQFPIEVAHGEGVWLHARDGRKILDFYGGHAVAGLGYGHPRWHAALERQARQMAFQTNAVPLGIREGAAAPGAATWWAVEKWYGLPRPPFDVGFTARDNPAAAGQFIDRNTAAVIVD